MGPRNFNATFLVGVQSKCNPQTIAVCQTRADGLGLKVVVSDEADFVVDKDVCGVLVQYPATDGSIADYKGLADKVCIVNGTNGLCFVTQHQSSRARQPMGLLLT